MQRILSLSALLLFSLVTGAAAQDRGTKAEQAACTPDVFRLCSAYIPSEPSIVACLQSNKRNLSQGCHDVFFPRRAMLDRAKLDLDMTPTGSIAPTKVRQRKVSLPHRRVVLAWHRTHRVKR